MTSPWTNRPLGGIPRGTASPRRSAVGKSLNTLGCFVLLICAACALAPAGAGAGTLDQQQGDATGSALDAYSNQSLAQTFTAGHSGKIDQVDLHLGEFLSPSAPLSVEIRNVSGGLPGSMVLASKSVSASDVPPDTAAAFVAINFAGSASVSAGTQYAIVAYSSTGFSNTYLWRESSTPNPYAGGVGVFTPGAPTSSWMSLGGDLAFKTYVAPLPATLPTTPTGQRAAALKKCKKKHSAARRRKCRKKAQLLPV